MFEMTADTEEKKKYVSDGKYIKNVCVECHVNVVKHALSFSNFFRSSKCEHFYCIKNVLHKKLQPCAASVHSFLIGEIWNWCGRSIGGHDWRLLALDGALKSFILMRIRWKENVLTSVFLKGRFVFLLFRGKGALLQISSLFYGGGRGKTVNLETLSTRNISQVWQLKMVLPGFSPHLSCLTT